MSEEEDKICIDPVTRLEGHAKIDIHLDEDESVDRAYFQTTELRGFEEFCQGRQVEEMPRIAPRICGVCPWPHHMAAVKASDRVWGVEPTVGGEKLRRLMYNLFHYSDKILHFYYLAAPDFVMGPKADPDKRNVVGMVEELGEEKVARIAGMRRKAQEMLEDIGGRAIHPVFGVPGGVSQSIDEEKRAEMEKQIDEFVEFAEFTLQLFKDMVLGDDEYRELIAEKDLYHLETCYMSLVGEDDKIDLYGGGEVKIIGPDGEEVERFKPENYDEYIGEHSEPWSYPTFPYLKKFGYNGLEEGKETGLYRVGPLARLNASSGFKTERAQQEYEEFFEVLPEPCHHTLAMHWARLIEMLYTAERMKELITDNDITSDKVKAEPGENTGRGVGAVEAQRGTLFHDYETDRSGQLQNVNLLVATNHNIPAINMSVEKAAKGLIDGKDADQGILNMVEMAFRAYDPCLACSTHSALGETPMKVEVFDSENSKILEKANLEDS
ncbi:MAG: Ni/Fe hydrogenase subunit alpha [Candidatus Nanohalobium sp.]